MRTIAILLAISLAGCGADMPSPQMRTIEEMNPVKGIDQSENPVPGSVYDMVNLDTSKGYLSLRPGMVEIRDLTGSGLANVLAEYLPDHRYPTSHYKTILVGRNSGTAQTFEEVKSSHEVLTPSYPTLAAGKRTRFSVVRYLWKYGTNLYTPVLVMANGIDVPVIYHQKDGTGKVEFLDAIDDDLTDLTYLGSPPRAKWLESFKGHLFAANVPDGGNRVYMTTVDSAGVPVCNIWPSSFNFDVGDVGEITGIKAFKDYLVVFKKDRIYTVLIDDQGQYTGIELADAKHGAINGHSILDIGDALLFTGTDGIYRWSGGEAVRISHPKIQDSWNDVNMVEGESKVPYAVYDKAGNRAMFALGMDTEKVDTAFVLDMNNMAWNRWGAWPGDARAILPFGFPEIGIVADRWEQRGPVVMAVYNDRLCLLKDKQYFDDTFGGNFAIHWYIKTQEFFRGEVDYKLLRHVMVSAKKTGDWQMSVLALADNETIPDAMKRDVGDAHNVIIDEVNAAAHQVGGLSQFNLITDGPVDVYYMPVNHKVRDSDSLADNATVDVVELKSAYDSTGQGGKLLILPHDTNPTEFIDMYEDSSRLVGTGTVGDMMVKSPQFVPSDVGMNVMGRTFRLWLSNVGSYSGGVGYDYAKLGMPVEINGWGIWYIPKGVLRPG